MAAGERQGKPTRCGSCLSKDLDYLEDGTGKCRACGAETRPFWLVKVPVPESRPVSAVRRPQEPAEAPRLPSPIQYRDPKTRAQLKQTKQGVTFLLIGTLLAWVPFVNLFGGLLFFLGGLYIARGRRAFGPPHSDVAIIAAVLAGLAWAGAILWVVGSYVGNTSLRPPVDYVALHTGSDLFLVGLALSALGGLAFLLLTIELQKTIGQRLLLGALGVGLAVTVVMAATGPPALGGSWPLQVVPAILFAIPLYLARLRLERGEVLPKTQASKPVPGGAV